MTSFTEVYSPVRCVDCAAELEPDLHAFGRCFACERRVRLRAERDAYFELYSAMADCASCASDFNVPGPADGRLCDDCRRDQRNEDQS